MMCVARNGASAVVEKRIGLSALMKKDTSFPKFPQILARATCDSIAF